MKRGFTLLEMLVASCLLGMLVTILTMVFNQSAIAWRTGKAGVSEMSEGERNVSASEYLGDNIIPGLQNDALCLVSPWKDADTDNTKTFSDRGVISLNQLSGTRKVNSGSVKVSAGQFSGTGTKSWSVSGLGSATRQSVRNFIVGVKSLGPDGVEGTKDDITTWPEDKDFAAQ